MQLYLSLLDMSVKKDSENASIGIILCKEKSKTLAEIVLKDINKPIGVATYKTYSEIGSVPKDISKYLPTTEEIIQRLTTILES